MAVALAVAATVVPSAIVTAADRGMNATWDMTSEWREAGWTCYRVPNVGSDSIVFDPTPRYDLYRIVFKGGKKMNPNNDSKRVVIFNAQQGTTYEKGVHFGQTISHYVWCGKSPNPPVGGGGEMYGKAYGPKGDPWYRFTFWNSTDASGTCFVKVNGDIIFKKPIPAGAGFKTGWRFVPGYARVQMACWQGGEKVWGNRFRAAPPGYYGPLWFGYTRGYF